MDERDVAKSETSQTLQRKGNQPQLRKLPIPIEKWNGVGRHLVFIGGPHDENSKFNEQTFESKLLKMSLRVLSFNVFAGSPLPHLFNGTPSLAKSSRLERQVTLLRELSADVICLQEVPHPLLLHSCRSCIATKLSKTMRPYFTIMTYFTQEKGLLTGLQPSTS